MRSIMVGKQFVHSEAPEAGRYHAPILLLPGLFQSFIGWRAVTSVLAHRGWEVYCLARTMLDEDGEHLITEDDGWAQSLAKARKVADELGDKIIYLGADVGAALAIELARDHPPLAMGLFAPSQPKALATRYRGMQGLFGRLASAKGSKPVAPPSVLAKQAPFEQFTVAEPARFLADLSALPDLEDCGVPSIVFAAEGDPLVAKEESEAFGRAEKSKLAANLLDGHWWSSDPGPVADQIHRFLILTLGDRIVEFPDEILED